MSSDRVEVRVRSLMKTRRRDARPLQLALEYLHSDPPGSLTKTRTILEGVVLEMHELEMGGPPRKPLLGDMLANNQFARLIERRMLSRMHAVRDMANLGTHGEKVDATDARRALENLCDILDWYIEKYGASPEVGRTTTMTPPVPRRKLGNTRQLGAVGAVMLVIAIVGVLAVRMRATSTSVPGAGSAAVVSSTLNGLALPSGIASSTGPRAGDSATAGGSGTAPTLTEPRDEASFTPRSRAHMLRWQPAAGHESAMSEVELVRVSPTAEAFPIKTSPDGQPYLVIDWNTLTDKPGRYRWRVREKGANAWSAWRVFSFYPSELARIQSEKRVRIGIEKVQHPPFVSWNPDAARYVGFDIELGEKVAAELGAQPQLLPRAWDELLAATMPADFDAVISAISITPERCARYAFSNPYLVTGQRLAKTTSKPTGADDLFVLGVQRNTTSERVARVKFKRADVRLIDTNDLVFAALAEGRVEAILMDDVLLRTRPEARPDAGAGWILDGSILSSEAYGIMLPRDEPELREKIDGILQELRESGWMNQLLAKHGIQEAPRQDGLGCPPRE